MVLTSLKYRIYAHLNQELSILLTIVWFFKIIVEVFDLIKNTYWNRTKVILKSKKKIVKED